MVVPNKSCITALPAEPAAEAVDFTHIVSVPKLSVAAIAGADTDTVPKSFAVLRAATIPRTEPMRRSTATVHVNP